jgi:hypothetical protein
MSRASTGNCPEWCVSQHDVEDEGTVRHRGPTLAVPGVAIRGVAPHDTHGIEVLLELHAEGGDAVAAVYIGDGVEGIDVSVETAARLVQPLIETLRQAGVAPG